jgi:hypothetical protein
MAETTRSAGTKSEGTRTAPAKKATKQTPQKQAAKKQPAKKQPAKKQPAKKQPAAKSAKSAPKASPRPESSGRSSSADGVAGPRAALEGAQQLVDLTGKEFEGIVGLAKDDDGWTIQVEVLEMRRIPTTTDVLAVYDVNVDQSGALLGYRRVDRYVRGSAGEEGQ